MDASQYDRLHYPTLSVQEGYTEWAGMYDAKATTKELMDYRLLSRIQGAHWEQMETVADLACGTGRIGAWLKEHGAHFLDGVDMTEAMLEQARAKNIYRSLSLADLRHTPLQTERYDLVSVGLADDHLPTVAPLYQEAARLTRPEGYLVLVGYHPFFQISGIPTTFERSTGESATIEGYIHLFSEHIQAANEYGWQLRDMQGSLIDDEWIARRPHAERHKGWPVSFAFLWQKQQALE